MPKKEVRKQMADDLRRVGLVFKEDGAVDFKKSLQEINLELNKNYNQFKLTQAQWDKSTKSTEKLRAEQEYLRNAYEIQADKVNTLKMQLADLENAENKNTTAIKKKRNELTSAEIKLESYNQKIKDIEKQLHNTGKKIEEFGTKVEKIGNRIEGAGKKLSAFSVATASAFVASAKSAIDFEDAFTGVEKTVDGTAEQMNNLKQGIRDMSKEIPSSTTEISAVAEAAGQLGIKTDDILSFTKVMIDLGNSTNLSAEEAASSLAKFANITNMSAKDYDKLGSTIVALGNNFATTEADIVAMSTRLAATGELAGLSQSQILSLATAMSSVGIEAEAGGSAMSKLLKKIQVAVETGSEDLKDYAKVAGMTSKEFKKAFEKDAVGALTAFISGLNDTERNGKSAITILEDMGLKETRLSNTILSLANASGVMTDAVRLGSKAWEDNDALTNEANKRYGTLKSQIQIAINKLKDLAITIGNKLTPVIPKVTKQIEKFTKWVEKLDDKQVEWILNVGKAVIAIGPLITILGKITKTGGTAIKTIGTFTQAIGVAKGTVTSTSVAVNKLAGVITGITSPVGAAIIATTALTAVVIAANRAINDNMIQEKNRTKEIEKTKKSLEDLKQQQQQNLDANLSEVENVQRLRNELGQLVDENGVVQDKYKGRVQFILNELNKALGTEYKMTGDVIDQYKDLTDSIDETINKKKASIILSTQEESYTNAIKNQAEATRKLGEIQADLNDRLKKRKELEEQLETASKEGGNYSDYQKIRNQITSLDELISKTRESYNSQEDIVKTYYQDIATYEKNAALVQEGTAESIKKVNDSVLYSYQKRKDDTIASLNEAINAESASLATYKEMYENNQEEITKNQQEQSQQRLNTLVDELIQSTSTINENSPEVQKAWSDLAYGSYNTYYDKVSQLPEELSNKIQEMTGVTIQRTPELVNETSNMSQQVLDQIEQNQEFKQEALNNLKGLLSGLQDEQLRQLLKEAGVEDVDKVMEGIKNGDLSEDEGINILKNLHNGLNNSSWQNSLWSTARGIASKLSGLLSIKADVNGNTSAIPGHKLGLDYVPKDNYLARLHKGERVLTKEENEEYTNAEESNRKSKIPTSNIDYNRLTEALAIATNSANQKIIDLLTRILAKNPQIVMDSGTLVGEIIDPIDQEMGNRQSRRERGT